jgi:hypothetical protein
MSLCQMSWHPRSYRPASSGRLHVAINLEELLGRDLEVEQSGIDRRVLLLEVGAGHDRRRRVGAVAAAVVVAAADLVSML